MIMIMIIRVHCNWRYKFADPYCKSLPRNYRANEDQSRVYARQATANRAIMEAIEIGGPLELTM